MAEPTANQLAFWGQYGDLYNEIVRPDRKYTISHYLRTQWGPLLGPARLWFVVALRQRCFWNNKQDWCIVDKQTLANETGFSTRTINRMVEEEGYLSWFFDKARRRRYSQQAGRTVNAPNRYQVLLDDPLTPTDQEILARYLTQAITDNSPLTTLSTLQTLCACSSAELRECLSAAPPSMTAPAIIPAAFAFDVIKAYCPLPSQESVEYIEIARAASRLHNAFTQPERVYMGNQYFRLNWLPILGPVLALLVVNLRARCYWNEHTGELRSTCHCSWAELAQEIGCTDRQLRNVRSAPYLSRFITILEEGHGVSRSHLQIQMPDPLTDADQQQFDQASQSAAASSSDPETGQISMLLPLHNAETLAQSNAEVLASSGRKNWHIEGLGTEILAHESGNFGTCLQLHIITMSLKGLIETTIELPCASQKVAEQEAVLAAAIRNNLLTNLMLLEPNKGGLLKLCPRCDHVFAWGLYALTQSGLSKNKAGYVYNRLVNGDSPPQEMLDLASLTPSQWHDFVRFAAAHPTGVQHRQQILQQENDGAQVQCHQFALWQELLEPIWDNIVINLLNDKPTVQTESGVDLVEQSSIPVTLSELLLGSEFIDQKSGEAIIATTNLYHAYTLSKASEGLREGIVRVRFVDRHGAQKPLNAEILSFSAVAPLSEDSWAAVIKELCWQMPQGIFDRWWTQVKPLGVVKTNGGEEEQTVILGTLTSQAQEWLAARQTMLAERVLSGVLNRPVNVHFVVCVEERMPALA